jgi:hypothetical protein
MALLAGVLIFSAIFLVGFANQLALQVSWIEGILQELFELSVSIGLTFGLLWALYYGLPNRKQSFKAALKTAAFASLAWVIANLIFRNFATEWSLQSIYGPFYVSMTLLLWAYTSGCILLGAARLSSEGFFGIDHFTEETPEVIGIDDDSPLALDQLRDGQALDCDGEDNDDVSGSEKDAADFALR